MKVAVRLPTGMEGWQRYVEMPAAPREGDTIDLGDGNFTDSYEVRRVVWYPNDPDFDVMVVLKP